jgi:hypothetical protein
MPLVLRFSSPRFPVSCLHELRRLRSPLRGCKPTWSWLIALSWKHLLLDLTLIVLRRAFNSTCRLVIPLSYNTHWSWEVLVVIRSLSSFINHSWVVDLRPALIALRSPTRTLESNHFWIGSFFLFWGVYRCLCDSIICTWDSVVSIDSFSRDHGKMPLLRVSSDIYITNGAAVLWNRILSVARTNW